MQERFLQSPFFPQGRVTCVALDGRFNGGNDRPDLKALLEERGIRVILVPPCPDLGEAVSGHADMQLHPVDGRTIVIAPNAAEGLKKELADEGFTVIEGEKKLGPLYPADSPYNVLRIGSLAFHNLKNTDPVLRQQLELRGVRFSAVKQGYTKCLTVALKENALVTEDQGIKKAALACGLDVCCLDKTGGIYLPPYDSGFLGGSSGLLGPGLLTFTGRIDRHPEKEKLASYLAGKNMTCLYLAEGPAWDVGSLIPLKEVLP